MDKIPAQHEASIPSSPSHYSRPAKPLPPVKGAAGGLGDQFLSKSGDPPSTIAQAVAPKQAMSLVEFHDALARESSTQEVLKVPFQSYLATAEGGKVHFFSELAGLPVLNSMDDQQKAATLLISDLSTGSTQPYGVANPVGLQQMRLAVKGLHPRISDQQVDSILIHYALNLGGVVSSEGWVIEPESNPSNRLVNFTGPAESALLDSQEKSHCFRSLVESGKVYLNAQLPDRAHVLVGSKDLPCLLNQAVYQGDGAAVALLIKHGADVHGSQLNRLEGKFNSPLAVAVRTNQPEIFKQLIEKGADVHDAMLLTRDVGSGKGATRYQVKVDPAHIDPANNPPKIDAHSIQSSENRYFEFPSVKYFIDHVMSDPAQRASFQAHMPDTKASAV